MSGNENMGPEKTELFIATLLKERFDYTEWRRGITERINTFEALDAFVETGKSSGTVLFDSSTRCEGNFSMIGNESTRTVPGDCCNPL